MGRRTGIPGEAGDPLKVSSVEVARYLNKKGARLRGHEIVIY